MRLANSAKANMDYEFQMKFMKLSTRYEEVMDGDSRLLCQASEATVDYINDHLPEGIFWNNEGGHLEGCNDEVYKNLRKVEVKGVEYAIVPEAYEQLYAILPDAIEYGLTKVFGHASLMDDDEEDMDPVEDLKFAVFNEWSYDHPAGTVDIYYDVYSDDIDEFEDSVEEIVTEIVDHMKNAIGYDEGDEDDDFDEEDDYDDIELLDPRNEDGTIDLDTLANWNWDNGGVGCRCAVYAEGEEIIDAVEDFYKDVLMDWVAVPEFDCDDDDLSLEFIVNVSMGGGDGGDVCVEVPVSKDELDLMILCFAEGGDLEDYEELSDMVERIKDEALEEAEYAAEDLDMDLDCSEATCMISMPEELEEYNTYSVERIIEYARENSDDIDAVKMMLRMVSELVEEHVNNAF